MKNARNRLWRARKALTAAEAANDPARTACARERVREAEDGIEAVKILSGANQPDVPNAAGLRRAEREAVSGYTGGEFGAINKYLENGNQVPSYAADDRDYVRHMRQTVSALTRAVNRSKLATRTAATRAIPAATAMQVYGPVGSRVGQTITERRFTSTTTNGAPDPTFGNVTITYDLAPGTRALDINSSGVPCAQGENELLIGSHQDFVVAADEMVAGKRVIRLHSTAFGETYPTPPNTAARLVGSDVS
ncbi:ADP-ribosyltransferase [Amycolatopsis sp. NPDC058986]|uniref:ADP-ribosyltransferase n=1 Tax=unclassified Amycolatopsis TaxID=2618356 RepID=UPI00366DBB8E